MSDYERDELKKLWTVIKAAGQNGSDDAVEISTRGHNPHASVTIKGYVLEKFIKTEPQ